MSVISATSNVLQWISKASSFCSASGPLDNQSFSESLLFAFTSALLETTFNFVDLLEGFMTGNMVM